MWKKAQNISKFALLKSVINIQKHSNRMDRTNTNYTLHFHASSYFLVLNAIALNGQKTTQPAGTGRKIFTS